jgi:hypothetical protein
MRRSIATQRNHHFGNWTEWAKRKSNGTFFKEALQTLRRYGLGDGAMIIGLVGSRTIPGVTLRHAQRVLRWDRKPSYWSHAFLLARDWDGQEPVARLPIIEAPLFPRNGRFPDPATNAVTTATTLGAYGDRELDANVALISVCRNQPGQPPAALDREEIAQLTQRAAEPNFDRQRYDLWDQLCVWQQYLWSDATLDNPLMAGHPVPATAFVEMVFEAIGLDLVPNASARNSAPEHLWTAFHWWLQQDLREHSDEPGAFVTAGCFALRDPGCATAS